MQFESDEEGAIDIPTDEDEDNAVDREQAAASEVAPRRSTRKRNVVTGGYQEDASDGGDGDIPHDPKETADEDIEMAEDDAQVPYEMVNDAGMDGTGLIAMDQSENATPAPVKVKSEQPEPTIPQTAPQPDSPIAVDPDPPAPPLPTNPEAGPDTILVDSDEEEKPKPIMKLKYQGFSIGGRCLCVIVEPYPPRFPKQRVHCHSRRLALPAREHQVLHRRTSYSADNNAGRRRCSCPKMTIEKQRPHHGRVVCVRLCRDFRRHRMRRTMKTTEACLLTARFCSLLGSTLQERPRMTMTLRVRYSLAMPMRTGSCEAGLRCGI